MLNTASFYLDDASGGTDIKSIKLVTEELEKKFEIDVEQVSLEVPATNFNIVILGENTQGGACGLLGLKPERSTTLMASA